jgi:hypothetical protein
LKKKLFFSVLEIKPRTSLLPLNYTPNPREKKKTFKDVNEKVK